MTTSKMRLEAMLFASGQSLDENRLSEALDNGQDLLKLLRELDDDYAHRGVRIVRTASGWAVRTREDSSDIATTMLPEQNRLTRAALEALAVIASYQPVTRSEIERVRGVQLSPGVMRQLLDAGYIHPGSRRDTPGRPLTWMTTNAFLEAYDLLKVSDLPSFGRLQEAGVFELPKLQAETEDATDLPL